MVYNITKYLIRALVLVTALPVHEFAHGWVASKLGDNTAKYQGRLTLNPVKHLDIIGSIAMIFVGFGWAKPVPINPRNFKNQKVGMAISSLAGPVSNLILAYIFMIIMRIVSFVGARNGDMLVILDSANKFSIGGSGIYYTLTVILYYLVYLNIGLAVFNLLPIPPLDGSRIATLFLSNSTYFKIMQYERYIFIGLIFLMYSGVLSTPIMFLINIGWKLLIFLSDFLNPIFNAVM